MDGSVDACVPVACDGACWLLASDYTHLARMAAIYVSYRPNILRNRRCIAPKHVLPSIQSQQSRFSHMIQILTEWMRAG